jgi:hypothetical protein
MSSPTLEAILRHWTAPLDKKKRRDAGISEELERFVLPFDVQSFCAENDETLSEARHIIAEFIWSKGNMDMEKLRSRGIDFINLTSGI